MDNPPDAKIGPVKYRTLQLRPEKAAAPQIGESKIGKSAVGVCKTGIEEIGFLEIRFDQLTLVQNRAWRTDASQIQRRKVPAAEIRIRQVGWRPAHFMGRQQQMCLDGGDDFIVFQSNTLSRAVPEARGTLSHHAL